MVRKVRKQHRITVIVLIFTIFLILTVPHVAHASGPEDGMMPSVTSLFNGSNNSVYLNQYRDNYYLDLKETGIFKSFNLNIFNGIANILFKLETALTYLLIVIVYYSFKISFTDILSPVLNAVVKSLQQGIFNQLVLVCISLLGVFYIAKIIRDQKSQVWSAIIQTILIITLSMWFLNNPATVLKSIDDFSQGASQVMLEGTFKATNAGDTTDSAVVSACNSIWVMFVHKPWQILEFGNVEMAEQHESKILTLAPGSDERQEIINDLGKDGKHFAPMWGLSRLAMQLLYLIPLLIMAAIIAIICLLVLIYQALMVVVAMMGPIIFLMALVPWWGFRAVKGWSSKLIGYGSMKIILSFFIAVMFSFMIAIYNLNDKYGWFVVIILQLIVVAGIYWKREELFDWVATMRNIHNGPQQINKQIRKDANVEGYMKNLRNKRLSQNAFSNGYADSIDGTERDNSKSEVNSQASNMGDSRKTSKVYSSENTSERTPGASPGTVTLDTKPKDRSNIKDIEARDIVEHEWIMDKPESIFKENTDLKQLLKIAEEILEQQYESSKNASEEKALKMGKEPEYSSFVKSVQNREKMNLPRFDEREKMAIANDLKTVIEAGGRPEDLYYKDILDNPKSIESPRELILRMDGQEEIVSRVEFEAISISDLSDQYTSEFNNDYDKKYDTKFMENLIKKYGRENVRYMLDQMRDINRKEEIKNPAGYLTQGLKNNSMNHEYPQGMRNKDVGM